MHPKMRLLNLIELPAIWQRRSKRLPISVMLIRTFTHWSFCLDGELLPENRTVTQATI